MNIKLELSATWLMACVIKQKSLPELMAVLSRENDENNWRRAMAPDLAKRQQEILDKAAMAILEIENEWLRRLEG